MNLDKVAYDTVLYFIFMNEKKVEYTKELIGDNIYPFPFIDNSNIDIYITDSDIKLLFGTI